MTSSPKVAALVITPPVYKASGGVSAAIQLSRKIAERTALGIAVMADRDAVTEEDGLPIHWVKAGNRLGIFAKLAPGLLRTAMWRGRFDAWLDAQRPDVVHLHNPHPPGALAAIAATCERRGIPYVITTHGLVEYADYARGFESPAWLKPVLNLLVRRPLTRVLRGAAKIFILSPFELPITRSMGIDDSRTAVVTNGVDPYFCAPTTSDEDDRLVSRFNIPSGVTRFLFVGNHTRNKGIDLLLKAIQQIEGGCAVISGGIRSEREHRAMLAEAGLAPDDPRICFTGFASREELRALYRTADVFVFPSRADTLPLVILEAMASALPVVSTGIGGIPYEVTADTGRVVPPSDAAALATAMAELAADASLREQLGEAGRERALTMFSWDRSADLAIAQYDAILEGRS